MCDVVASKPRRVLLVLSDRWTRALLRAELIERGMDAVGAPDLATALLCRPVDVDRGPVRVVLVEEDALFGTANVWLDLLLSRHHAPAVVLLGGTQLETPPGPWSRVLRRPLLIGEIAAEVEELSADP